MAHLARFVFQEDMQRAFAHFTRVFGIRIVFFSYDGRELNVGDNRQMCRYCRLLREELGYDAACRMLDREKQLLATQQRQMVSYQCHGGMMEAVMPVYHVERLLGFVMIGQFRMIDEVPPSIIERARADGDEDGLRRAFLEAPFYAESKVTDILGLFSILVDFIVGHRLISIKSHEAIATLVQYLDSHPDETLSLAEAAALTHRSTSSLAHLFKEATGKSFRQHQIQHKLDKAEEYFRGTPDTTVAEVAARLGFTDPLYFSRLYKKHRGISPSRFRAQLRKSAAGRQTRGR